MNVKLFITKDYRKKDDFAVQKNEPNSKPNKANVKIGKMNISIATRKDYDKEQRTTNNERYSKQTQFKANFETAPRRVSHRRCPAEAPADFNISLSLSANGRVSGTTCTSVVNL